MSLPIMRRVTCSRSGRRRCAWTWLLQRSVIHDIIKLLNSDSGLWAGVVTGTRKTHTIIFLWTCFDVLSQPRGYYDAFATARVGCSAGREWLLSPEGTARAEFFCAFHDTTTLLNDDAVWLSLLQVLGVWEQAHKTRGSFRPPSFVFVSQPVTPGGTAAAAPGLLRCVPFLVEGQLLGGSQDTRHVLAISQVGVVCHRSCLFHGLFCVDLLHDVLFYFLAEFPVLFASRCSTARQ